MAGSRPACGLALRWAEGPWPDGQAAPFLPARRACAGVCGSAQVITPQKPLMGWSPGVRGVPTMFSCSLWVPEKKSSRLCGIRPKSGASDSFPERSRPKSELRFDRRGDLKLHRTGRGNLSGTREPHVSADGGAGPEFVREHQTAPSVLRSGTIVPALGSNLPSLPRKGGHGEGQASTQWGGSLGG